MLHMPTEIFTHTLTIQQTTWVLIILSNLSAMYHIFPKYDMSVNNFQMNSRCLALGVYVKQVQIWTLAVFKKYTLSQSNHMSE